MRWPRSLQGRLALSLGIALTLLWLGATWATATLLRGEMEQVFDSALEETAQRILPLAVRDILDRDEEDLADRIATLRQHEELYTYVVRNDQNHVLIRSHAAEDADFPPFDGMGFCQKGAERPEQEG